MTCMKDGRTRIRRSLSRHDVVCVVATASRELSSKEEVVVRRTW